MNELLEYVMPNLMRYTMFFFIFGSGLKGRYIIADMLFINIIMVMSIVMILCKDAKMVIVALLRTG